MVDDDPIDELRSLWQSLEPPADPEPDEATHAVVDWLREAWQAQPVPEAPSIPTPRRTMRPAVRAAAALLVAVTVGVGLWALAATSPSGSAGPAGPGKAEPREALAPVTALREDGVEMRSGPVRLVLVYSSVPAGAETEDRKERP